MTGSEAMGKNKHRTFSLNIRKHFFTVRVMGVLAQVFQGGCRISLFRDIQKLFGHDPGKPVLCDLALAEGLDYIIFRGSMQTHTFFDSVK